MTTLMATAHASPSTKRATRFKCEGRRTHDLRHRTNEIAPEPRRLKLNELLTTFNLIDTDSGEMKGGRSGDGNCGPCGRRLAEEQS
jgi:hypothetical protein